MSDDHTSGCHTSDLPAAPGTCWIDLRDPLASRVQSFGDRFGIHELALEDAQSPHQRPKLEHYGDSLFLVAKPAEYDDDAEAIRIGELSILIGPDHLVTVHHGVACRFAPTQHHVEQIVDRCEIPSVVHRLLDRVVDAYRPIVEGVTIDVEQIEADVFSPERSNPSGRIYSLKRQVLDLLRNMEPLIAPLDELAAGTPGPEWEATRDYFRDVADHTRRMTAELHQLSLLLSDVLQANLAQVSVAQNEDMRRMSAWAAIFLLPSLLAGVWGMNFTTMPETDWRWGYPFAIAVMVASALGLWANFRRIGWLSRS